MVFGVIFFSLFLVSFVLATKSFVNVKENEEAVVERFGIFNRMLGSGVHFIIPFFETLRALKKNDHFSIFLNSKKICISPKTMIFPKDDRIFYAANNEQLKLRCEIVYQITDPYKAIYEVDFLFDAINQMLAGIIQKRLIEKKEENQIENVCEICKSVIDKGNEYSINWGVKLIEFHLKQITETNGIRHIIEK